MESYLFKKISEIFSGEFKSSVLQQKKVVALAGEGYLLKIEPWPNQLISLTCWAADASEILDTLNLLPS